MLIDDFIEQKVKEYDEPQRRGVPRGQEIGFSRVKYRASLEIALRTVTVNGLYTPSLKQIAKKLDVSYSVLRLWNIEPGFKKLKRHWIKEFGRPFKVTITKTTTLTLEASGIRSEVHNKVMNLAPTFCFNGCNPEYSVEVEDL